MGKPDITNAERPERVRVGGVDVKRAAQFRKRFPPAAKRHLFIRDHILFEQKDTPVNPERTEDVDPDETARWVKDWVLEAGADAVGIAQYDQRFTFAQVEQPGAQDDQPGHGAVIVFAMAMKYDYMADIGPRSQDEVHRIYYRLDDLGVRLANQIGGFGYRARMQANGGDIPLVPFAWLAGLGELGKHGSLISPELGSSFRLGAVSTDLPLTPDGPKDFGIEEVCASCNICTRFCPGDAIGPDKKTVAGIERWSVDRAACEPWFHRLYGCKICLMVCPLNAKSIFAEAFKPTARDIRDAKDAKGLLALIESRTEMRYGELDYGAAGDPPIAPEDE